MLLAVATTIPNIVMALESTNVILELAESTSLLAMGAMQTNPTAYASAIHWNLSM